MKLRTVAAAMLALALSAGAAAAQPAKSLADQIVGTWNFVVAEVAAPDGKKSFPFGETPKGILIFTPDGRFAQIHVAGDVPKIASNNRMTGTLTLRVKLNVAPWLRRPGRIYLVLPAQQPGAMNASWSTQGRLLAGRLSSGSRSLVYSGLIMTPFIEDVLQLTLEVDGTRMRQLYHVNFRFEMDEE